MTSRIDSCHERRVTATPRVIVRDLAHTSIRSAEHWITVLGEPLRNRSNLKLSFTTLQWIITQYIAYHPTRCKHSPKNQSRTGHRLWAPNFHIIACRKCWIGRSEWYYMSNTAAWCQRSEINPKNDAITYRTRVDVQVDEGRRVLQINKQNKPS